MLTPTYIFDSSRLFRDGLQLILGPTSFEVAGTGEKAADLHDVPKTEEPLLLIVGTMTDLSVLDFIGFAVSAHPMARIVVLAEIYNHRESVDALAHGAKGYLHKGLSAQSFVKALQLISEDCSVVCGWPLPGETFGKGTLSVHSEPTCRDDEAFAISRSIMVSPASGASRPLAKNGSDARSGEIPAYAGQPFSRASGTRHLSPRERTILRLVMSGGSNKQIARELDITESTVKVHIKTILRKIDVKNRTQAAIWAMADPAFAEPHRHN